MSIIQPLFAQDTLSVDMVSAPWQKMDATTRDILIILGSVALVTILALIWAVVFRSRRRSHSRHQHHHHHHHHNRHQHGSEESSTSSAVAEEEAPPSSARRKGRRHRRRQHRPRNPTLAETGGLPPLRSAPPPEP